LDCEYKIGVADYSAKAKESGKNYTYHIVSVKIVTSERTVFFLLFQYKRKEMRATTRLIAGLTLVAVVGLAVYARRRHKTNRMNQKVADHGYETAYDILFPEKKRRSGMYKDSVI
jgi:hypothetical protein